ncbi:MAG: ATP-binding protein [Ignavibacteriaceae bacterium]
MVNLIDNLLSLSKLGRKEVNKSPVDMEALTKAALYEINKTIKHNAEIKIHKLHPAMADPTLINQVITNLLSNAIKYSSKKEQPVIEIQSEKREKEYIYEIRDNGAGFDTQNADDLFEVFQRFHSEKEFEGIGVGLAIVNLIIRKHGGRVWAEGKINEGAVFYFSLPEDSKANYRLSNL